MHPVCRGAGLGAKSTGEAQHRACACWRDLSSSYLLLALQPGQQLPGTGFIQMFHFFEGEFDCAHSQHSNTFSETVANIRSETGLMIEHKLRRIQQRPEDVFGRSLSVGASSGKGCRSHLEFLIRWQTTQRHKIKFGDDFTG